MEKLIKYIVIITIAVGFSGCSLLGGNGDSGSLEMIQTDREAYTAKQFWERESPRGHVLRQHGFEMIATFENTTDDTIYVNSCSGHIYLQAGPLLISPLSDDDETSYFVSCFNSGGDRPTFALEPGENRVDTLFVVSPRGWDGSTGEPLGVSEGSFQFIMYGTGICFDKEENEIPSDCRFSPEERPRSNVFEVKLEQ